MHTNQALQNLLDGMAKFLTEIKSSNFDDATKISVVNGYLISLKKELKTIKRKIDVS